MPLPEVGAPDVGLILFYLVVLVLPGGLVGAVGGLRGWSLAGAAPLLTYAVAGLAGPWTTSLGIRWSGPVLAVTTVALALAVAAVRSLAALLGQADSDPSEPPRRPMAANVGLAGAVAAAAVAGSGVVLGGLHRLGTVPQDWDAVFHANGIRWIADRGDASLFGMSQVNWYEPGTAIFYPNAYHLVGAVVRQITDRDLPAILNSHTALLPGMAALALAAMVRRFGGSSTHAGGAALAAVAVSALYDMLWRGPLLPYVTGAVLTPVFAILMADALDARGLRGRSGPVALLALATAGLVCIHPAMLFGAAVFAAALVLWRWIRRPRSVPREVVVLVLAGAAGLGLSFLQIAGSLYSASSFPAVDWPADLTWSDSITRILTFSHAADTLQVWLTVFAAIGLLTYHRLGELRWIGLPVLVFGTLFVLAASSDEPWVNALTRPWWNDRWRLAGVFALASCVLIGHGIGQVVRGVLAVLLRLTGDRPGAKTRMLTTATASMATLLAFTGVTHSLYFERNAVKMSINTGEGPALSTLEVSALRSLGGLVPDGVRVLNDRNDGSVWMYALSGALPVAGHYDGTGLGGTDVEVLESRFNQYDRDPEVRAAVQRLGVGYVYVAQGFLRGYNGRAAGLTDLGIAPFLEVVYRNPDAVLYRIVDGGAAL